MAPIEKRMGSIVVQIEFNPACNRMRAASAAEGRQPRSRTRTRASRRGRTPLHLPRGAAGAAGLDPTCTTMGPILFSIGVSSAQAD